MGASFQNASYFGADDADEDDRDAAAAAAEAAVAPSPPPLGAPAARRLVEKYDAVFFAGDLNYRLEGVTKDLCERLLENAGLLPGGDGPTVTAAAATTNAADDATGDAMGGAAGGATADDGGRPPRGATAPEEEEGAATTSDPITQDAAALRSLLSRDQLALSLAAGRAFSGFSEADARQASAENTPICVSEASSFLLSFSEPPSTASTTHRRARARAGTDLVSAHVQVRPRHGHLRYVDEAAHAGLVRPDLGQGHGGEPWRRGLGGVA